MNVLVCIKQVPDTTEIKIDPVKGTLIREGIPTILNPFDRNAVEAALQIKGEKGGIVTVITMGPPQAVIALRECVAMGADEAFLVSDHAFAGADTLATSRTLAKTIEKLGKFNIIICGKQAIDGDTAQVGPGIAEHLNLAQVTYVQKICQVEDDSMVVERAVDGGYEVVNVSLPAVITVEKSVNEPRLPTMMGTLKAHKKQIATLSCADISLTEDLAGINGSPTQVKRIFTPESRIRGEMLEADDEDGVCDLLINKLIDAKIV